MSPRSYQSPRLSEEEHAEYEEYKLLPKDGQSTHLGQMGDGHLFRQSAGVLATNPMRGKLRQSLLCIALLLVGALVGGFLFTSWAAPQEVRPVSQSLDQLLPAAEGSRTGIVMVKYGSGTRFLKRSEQDPFERTIEVNKQYAMKWGYPHWLSRQSFLTGTQGDRQTAMYTKQGVVLSVILDELRKPEDQRLDWLFFFDADAVIVNHNIPLETFLPPDNEFGESQFLLCSRDPWGTINSGIYAIRVSEMSVKFLTTLISLPTVLDTGNSYSGGEQSSMCRTVAHEHFNANVSIVPSFWFNADSFSLYDSHYKGAHWPEAYRYGDFMIHFMTARKRMFREVLDAVEIGANSTLAPPLDETRYIKGDETVGAWYSARATLPLEQRIQDATTIFSGKTFTAASNTER